MPKFQLDKKQNTIQIDEMMDDYDAIIDSIKSSTPTVFEMLDEMITIFRRKHPLMEVNADELHRKMIAKIKAYFVEHPEDREPLFKDELISHDQMLVP